MNRKEILEAINQSGETQAEINRICSTELEKSFIKNFISLLYAEPGFSDVGIDELAPLMGITKPSCKGVLSSLVKKGIVYVDDHFASIIYLEPEYYHLHPADEWREAQTIWGKQHK